MRVLAIETATPVASAALVDSAGVRAERVLPGAMRQLEGLLPAVREMLADLGLAPDDVDAVAVSWGPGGFTGLRIGIATAAAWAQAANVPVLGIGTLEAFAAVPQEDGLILPALDAHRGEMAAALYRVGPSGPAEVVAPLVAAPERIAEEVGAHPGPILAIGDALERYGGSLAARLGPRLRLAGGRLHPRAATVGLLARPRLLAGKRTDPPALLPRYGRRPVVWPRPGPAASEA